MRPSEILAKRLDEAIAIAGRFEARGLMHPRVYGSVARGSDTERSDIDLIVDADMDASEDPRRALHGLWLELQILLAETEVSVALSQELAPFVLRQTEKDAVPLAEWRPRGTALPHDVEAVLLNRAALRVWKLMEVSRSKSHLSIHAANFLFGWCFRDLKRYGFLPLPPSGRARADKAALAAWAEECRGRNPEIDWRVRECENFAPALRAFHEACGEKGSRRAPSL